MLCHPAFFLITRKLARRNRVSCSQPRHVFHTGNFVRGKPSRTRRPPTLAGFHVSGTPETRKRTPAICHPRLPRRALHKAGERGATVAAVAGVFAPVPSLFARRGGTDEPGLAQPPEH